MAIFLDYVPKIWQYFWIRTKIRVGEVEVCSSESNGKLTLQAVAVQPCAVYTLTVPVVILNPRRHEFVDRIYHVGCYIITISIL